MNTNLLEAENTIRILKVRNVRQRNKRIDKLKQKRLDDQIVLVFRLGSVIHDSGKNESKGDTMPGNIKIEN